MPCFRAALNVALRVVHNLFNYTVVQNSQGGARYLWKEGPESTASLSFPNIHLWASNLSCWQAACD